MLLEVEVQGKNLRVISYPQENWKSTIDFMIRKGINIYYLTNCSKRKLFRIIYKLTKYITSDYIGASERKQFYKYYLATNLSY